MTTQIGSVVLAGGGTAGHVNPLLALADELRARESVAVTVLGTQGGLEDDLVPARGYPLRHVPKVPLPRRPSGAWVTLPSRLRQAIDVAGTLIDEAEARAVVGFGGYVSTPAYVAAHRRRLPIVVHEQNARAGLANRVGARWATRVGVTFPDTRLPGAQVTGMPLRREIADLVTSRTADATGTRVNAAVRLGIDPELVTVVVTGGSLGALSLNRAVIGAADALVAAGAQVLHLTGKGKSEEVRAETARLGARYVVRDYLAEMELAYAVADLVISRAGAGMVSELAALGVPAVYVPLPIGNGEQRLNAAPVVAAGGGVLVRDSEFTEAWVAENIPAILADSVGLAEMAARAGEAGIRDGAARLADLVAEAVGEESR